MRTECDIAVCGERVPLRRRQRDDIVEIGNAVTAGEIPDLDVRAVRLTLTERVAGEQERIVTEPLVEETETDAPAAAEQDRRVVMELDFRGFAVWKPLAVRGATEVLVVIHPVTREARTHTFDQATGLAKEGKTVV